jgi:Xaa-Pro aminopeptidase
MGGVRIEDTVLVTKTGSRVMSNVPKEIKELTRMLSNL